ncbi:unnamed protein product [Closterium sp. NIES-64]|nr:unnamed protein product [Closterium sp. NIES-64]
MELTPPAEVDGTTRQKRWWWVFGWWITVAVGREDGRHGGKVNGYVLLVLTTILLPPTAIVERISNHGAIPEREVHVCVAHGVWRYRIAYTMALTCLHLHATILPLPPPHAPSAASSSPSAAAALLTTLAKPAAASLSMTVPKAARRAR